MTGLTPGRSVLGGGAILMTCACGTATATAKLMGISGGPGGSGMATSILHPMMLGVGAVLMVYGLSRISSFGAWLAVGGFAVLAAAASITRPSVMTSSAMPWNATYLGGAALYVVAAAVLGYALWRSFPSPKPSASGGALAGAAIATGCGCCMVTGAIAGSAVTAGANLTFVQPSTVLHWTGLAMVAVGLFWLGGWRAAAWVPLGGAVIEYGPKLLKLTGDWDVSGVKLRFVPAYLVTLAGSGLIMYAFAVAYRRAAVGATERAPWPGSLGSPAAESAQS